MKCPYLAELKKVTRIERIQVVMGDQVSGTSCQLHLCTAFNITQGIKLYGSSNHQNKNHGLARL